MRIGLLIGGLGQGGAERQLAQLALRLSIRDFWEPQFTIIVAA